MIPTYYYCSEGLKPPTSLSPIIYPCHAIDSGMVEINGALKVFPLCFDKVDKVIGILDPIC